MSVYTIKMNIHDKPNSFKYCKENGIVGIGWGLEDNEKSSSADIGVIKSDLQRKYNSPHLSACLNTMKKMKCGDFVWTADVSNSVPIYYLCELASDYQCFDKSIWTECGIANGFNCTYYAITTDSLIPSGAVRYLNSKGLIFEFNDSKEIKATENIANAIKEIAAAK